MARAKDQAKWREKTERQRIEVYLPVEAVAELDRRVESTGESRAQVLARLLAPRASQEVSRSTEG